MLYILKKFIDLMCMGVCLSVCLYTMYMVCVYRDQNGAWDCLRLELQMID